MSGATFQAPDADGIGTIVIDRPDDSINALNLELIEDLGSAIRDARGVEGLKGLVIASGKPDQWVAGADLKIITQAATAHDVEAASRRFQAVCDELAWLPCTTVAAINGTALGGGMELALACDYRVAADSPSVSVGQPEVSLGLVPAGGGTQRLPRLIGLQQALDLILTGRRLNARRGRRAGVLDEVVHPTVLEQAARAWAMREPKRPLDRPLKMGLNVGAAMDMAEQTPAGRQLMYRQARSSVLARTHGHYPAPLRALAAVETGIEQGLAAGLDAESRAFGELAKTDTARNLIWLFMATQRQKRLTTVLRQAQDERDLRFAAHGELVEPAQAERDLRFAAHGELVEPPQAEREAKVERLGVVGAGFMGAAIAEVGAAAGLAVRVRDTQPEAVAKGLSRIGRMVDEGVKRRRFQPREGREIVQRVSGTTDYSGFANAELVIEAVFEDLAIKHRVLLELEAVLDPEAVIASNTSALPIHQIASAAKHPERVVGMHFFSPAERMPLLEVIRPAQADTRAVATAASVGSRMGKTVIVVGDSPGFYTSRVLGVMMNEAVVLLSEGARLEEVDRALTAFGFPVGPFVLYDEVGLEVAQHAGETVARAFGDRLPISNVVPELVKRGATGKRSGLGFYRWAKPPAFVGRFVKKEDRSANPVVYEVLGNPGPKVLGQDAIQDRLVLLFVNEAMRCLDEGVLSSPTDGDLGAVLGIGFPPFRGGPFHYADAIGAANLVDTLNRLADAHGSRYAPADVLKEGRRFFDA